MDGVDISVHTGCVYLDVDKSGEMHATTVHEIIAMTAEEPPDLKNVTTEVESIQQWIANLLPVRDRVRHEERRDPGSRECREGPTQRIEYGKGAQHTLSS